MNSGIHDLVVVGGGINGAGIARDAAGRGLSVLLCEKDDLGQHTSSASTKLIHGGLRYLEQYDFGLVRKALIEREVLLRSAPHIVGPLRFVMPHDSSQRPEWMIRAGLFLYDHLARRHLLPGSATIDLATHPAGAPLAQRKRKGFVYSDGWVQDARLVVLNAMDAAERGATVLTRTTCVAARRQAGLWRVSLQSEDGARHEILARALVNAAGPWVDRFLQERLGFGSGRSMRLVKGSHIVVRKLFDHPFAYIFQNPDKRIIFAIPFERDFTLIGTTDVEYCGDPARVCIDAYEIDYLCRMANRYFARPIAAQDVVWSYSGVRPLLDDAAASASSVTRDYLLDLDSRGAPLLTVYGGKITTYRKLAEEALDLLQPALGGAAPGWTAHAPLPGGDLPSGGIESFVAHIQGSYPWLPVGLAQRYCRSYGTRVTGLLRGARGPEDLGPEVADGLHARELDYLVEHEWARTADDILWRRSKLGLHLPHGAAAAVNTWLARRGERTGRVPPVMMSGRAAMVL